MPDYERELAKLSGDQLRKVATELGIEIGKKGDKRIREEALAILESEDTPPPPAPPAPPPPPAPSGFVSVHCARKGGVYVGPLAPDHMMVVHFAHGLTEAPAAFVAAAKVDPRSRHFFSPGYLTEK